MHRRRRAAAGETDLIDGIRADLAEVEDIAGEEMRLYLTDLALERARLALDVPAAFASPQAARAEAEAQTAKAALSSPIPAITAATANSPSCKPASPSLRPPPQSELRLISPWLTVARRIYFMPEQGPKNALLPTKRDAQKSVKYIGSLRINHKAAKRPLAVMRRFRNYSARSMTWVA